MYGIAYGEMYSDTIEEEKETSGWEETSIVITTTKDES